MKKANKITLLILVWGIIALVSAFIAEWMRLNGYLDYIEYTTIERTYGCEGVEYLQYHSYWSTKHYVMLLLFLASIALVIFRIKLIVEDK